MPLSIPDVRQQSDHDCGEAAVVAVLRYWGLRNKPAFATPQDGSDPRQLESALRLAGLKVLSGEMTIVDLRHFTKEGRPVICLTQSEGQGHYVVVSGVHGRYVQYHDVSCGIVHCTKKLWELDWHDRGRMGESFVHFGIAAWL